MTRTLTLLAIGSTWAVLAVDEETQSQWLDAFGTAILPTPHTTAAHALDVLEELRRLNPGDEVTYDPAG